MKQPYSVSGASAPTQRFSTYGDAQRYAWDALRGGFADSETVIKIRTDRGDRPMEFWTIGSSGKFKHSYESSKRRRAHRAKGRHR